MKITCSTFSKTQAPFFKFRISKGEFRMSQLLEPVPDHRTVITRRSRGNLPPIALRACSMSFLPSLDDKGDNNNSGVGKFHIFKRYYFCAVSVLNELYD